MILTSLHHHWILTHPPYGRLKHEKITNLTVLSVPELLNLNIVVIEILKHLNLNAYRSSAGIPQAVLSDFETFPFRIVYILATDAKAFSFTSSRSAVSSFVSFLHHRDLPSPSLISVNNSGINYERLEPVESLEKKTGTCLRK